MTHRTNWVLLDGERSLAVITCFVSITAKVVGVFKRKSSQVILDFVVTGFLSHGSEIKGRQVIVKIASDLLAARVHILKEFVSLD